MRASCALAPRAPLTVRLCASFVHLPPSLSRCSFQAAALVPVQVLLLLLVLLLLVVLRLLLLRRLLLHHHLQHLQQQQQQQQQ